MSKSISMSMRMRGGSNTTYQQFTRWLQTRIDAAPIDEQIKIYCQLAELLPARQDRRRARKISRALSKAAALQLDFSKKILPKKGSPRRRGGKRANPASNIELLKT